MATRALDESSLFYSSSFYHENGCHVNRSIFDLTTKKGERLHNRVS